MKSSVPYGIMFHHFHGGVHLAGQGSLSAQQFESILLDIGIDKILSARDWTQKYLSGTLAPFETCITFDDSLLCQFEIAGPVLDKYQIKAFWFTYTKVVQGDREKLEVYRKFRNVFFENFDQFYCEFKIKLWSSKFGKLAKDSLVGFEPSEYLKIYSFYSNNEREFRYFRDEVLGVAAYEEIMDSMIESRVTDIKGFCQELWMGAAHLKELHDDGHVIGLHSHSHPTNIASLSKAQQLAEYSVNQKIIFDIVGEKPWSVAHPVGSYSLDTLDILNELGVKIGFRDNDALLNPSNLEISRIDHNKFEF